MVGTVNTLVGNQEGCVMLGGKVKDGPNFESMKYGTELDKTKLFYLIVVFKFPVILIFITAIVTSF